MQKVCEDQRIDEVAEHFRKARRVMIITGAGVSAESGLPTYRGVGGLYEEKLTEDHITVEEALSPRTLIKRPHITWKYLRQIEEACRKASFNRAHEIITLLQQKVMHLCVLTQNIDSFHTKAGTKNVIEIHGNLHQLRCTRCDWTELVDNYEHLSEEVPHCKKCHGLMRPNVVLFGEMLDIDKVNLLRFENTRGFDLVISIGTSSVFPYIYEPVLMALGHGKPTYEVNPHPTQISDSVTHAFRCSASAFLEALLAKV